MDYQNDDTISKEQLNKEQPKADKSKNKDAMKAKLLASVAAGLAIGAGAAFAASHTGDVTVEDATAEENNESTSSESTHASSESTSHHHHHHDHKPTIEERVDRLEEKERIREQKEQEEPEQQKLEEHKPEEHKPEEHKPEEGNDVFEGHDVKIESMEEGTLNDGTTVQVYYGTIDNHESAFLANSEGRVVTAVIDANDNGNVDDNEVVDLRPANLTTQQLEQYQVEHTEHEVTVMSVENDVEIDGETVNVAILTVDDDPVMFIDSSQNGEVDLAIADNNQNGNIEDEEIRVVSDAHIPMPTADEVSDNTMVASVDDGSDDYTNDADVTFYDV